MRRRGCRDGCIWIAVTSGTCAKAVSCCLSQRQHGGGFKENHVAVIALHICGKSHSEIFKLLKPLKISRMFIYPAIKRYEEL